MAATRVVATAGRLPAHGKLAAWHQPCCTEGMDFDRRAVILVIVSGVLFAASLVLPALAVIEKPLLWGAEKEKLVPGITCLLMGWILLPGWVANPLLLAAALLHGFRHHTVAVILLVLALMSAVIAPFLLTGNSGVMRLRYPHAGYYAWAASIVTMLVSAIRSQAIARDRRLACA